MAEETLFDDDLGRAPRASGAPLRPVLAMTDSRSQFFLHELKPGENILGRGSDADVFLADGRISRAHARIDCTPDGSNLKCTLVDNGSKNGTFLNGQKIDGSELLATGDRVEIGACAMIFSHRTEAEIEAEKLLHFQATIDALTEVLNRGALDSHFQREWERGVRYGRPVCVLLIDLDDFKAINDTQGHAAGDYVLKRVARIILGEVRIHDMVGRYGGEEFAVMLPETTLNGALILAQRLCDRIAAATFRFDGAEMRVTASIGCSQTGHGPKESYKDLLKRADAALYTAKSKGKNRPWAHLPDGQKIP